MTWFQQGKTDPPDESPKITDAQRSYIEILLTQTDTELDEFTSKELHELTVKEASEIIDELKELPRRYEE
jgi:hypothetical protein